MFKECETAVIRLKQSSRRLTHVYSKTRGGTLLKNNSIPGNIRFPTTCFSVQGINEHKLVFQKLNYGWDNFIKNFKFSS